jgi:hypothetical protein
MKAGLTINAMAAYYKRLADAKEKLARTVGP